MNRPPISIVLAGALALASFNSHGLMVWQPVPKVDGHAGHGGRDGGKPFRLRDGAGAEVTFWTPRLAQRSEPLNDGLVKVSSRGVANYHALVASRHREGVAESAIRYLYMHGKPSGHSPSELTTASKATLEIVPDPLPREHWRYETGETARFLLRWQGEVLANAPLTLTTSHGSRIDLVSDQQGRVKLELPEDFGQITPGRRHNPPVEFVLQAEHRDGEQRYRTTLSAPYHVNPLHWQSRGLAFTLLGGGFLAGLGLVSLARRKTS